MTGARERAELCRAKLLSRHAINEDVFADLAAAGVQRLSGTGAGLFCHLSRNSAFALCKTDLFKRGLVLLRRGIERIILGAQPVQRLAMRRSRAAGLFHFPRKLGLFAPRIFGGNAGLQK